MKKNLFMGLTALVLAIGFVVVGCESPANGSNGGPGSPGLNSPNVVSTLAGIDAAVADGYGTVYVVGTLEVAANYIVPEITLIVSGTTDIGARSTSNAGPGNVVVAAGKTLTVPASAELWVAKDATLTVNGALSLTGGGKLDVKAAGHFNLTASSVLAIDGDSELTLDAAADAHITTGAAIAVATGATVDLGGNAELVAEAELAEENSPIKYAVDTAGIGTAFAGSGVTTVYYSGEEDIPGNTPAAGKMLIVTGEVAQDNMTLTVAGTLIVNQGASITTDANYAIAVTNAATAILTNNGTIVAGGAITKGAAGTINGSGTWLATAGDAINSLFALFPGDVTADTSSAIDLGVDITIPAGRTLVINGEDALSGSDVDLAAGRYNAVGGDVVLGYEGGLTIAGTLTGTPDITAAGSDALSAEDLVKIVIPAKVKYDGGEIAAFDASGFTGTLELCDVTLTETDSDAETAAAYIFGGNVLVSGTLTANGEGETTIKVAGSEFRFKDDDNSSVWFHWAAAVTFDFTGEGGGDLYLPRAGGMEATNTQIHTGDDITFKNCTVYRNSGNGYNVSIDMTFDNATLALSAALVNYYNQSTEKVITLKNGGAIAVSKHTTGSFTAPTKVLSAGAKDDQTDTIVTITLKDSGAEKAVFTPVFAYKVEISGTTTVTLGTSSGEENGIKLGDVTGANADIEIKGAPIFGGLVICVGPAYAATQAGGSAKLLGNSNTTASFTLNGTLYMDFSGWLNILQTGGSSDPTAITISGGGKLLYNKNGNAVFTKGATAPTVYVNTDLASNFGDAGGTVSNAAQFPSWSPALVTATYSGSF